MTTNIPRMTVKAMNVQRNVSFALNRIAEQGSCAEKNNFVRIWAKKRFLGVISASGDTAFVLDRLNDTILSLVAIPNKSKKNHNNCLVYLKTCGDPYNYYQEFCDVMSKGVTVRLWYDAVQVYKLYARDCNLKFRKRLYLSGGKHFEAVACTGAIQECIRELSSRAYEILEIQKKGV